MSNTYRPAIRRRTHHLNLHCLHPKEDGSETEPESSHAPRSEPHAATDGRRAPAAHRRRRCAGVGRSGAAVGRRAAGEPVVARRGVGGAAPGGEGGAARDGGRAGRPGAGRPPGLGRRLRGVPGHGACVARAGGGGRGAAAGLDRQGALRAAGHDAARDGGGGRRAASAARDADAHHGGRRGGRRRGGRGAQVIATCWPMGPAEQFGPQGKWRGEVWMTPGEAPTQGAQFSAKAQAGGGVALVLGAGNQSFLTVIDVLHCLFLHSECVLCKHHPLRGYQEPAFQAIFAPFIERGFMATVADGGREMTAALTEHALVKHIHVTGGKGTHDAIMWGPVEGRAQRMHANDSDLLKAGKTLTSELGAVTPWVVCPAAVSEAELAHQASHLTAALIANNSCNCNAPKLVLLADGWKQKQQFVDLVKGNLRSLPAGVPYYPGTRQRYEEIERIYAECSERVVHFRVFVGEGAAHASHHSHSRRKRRRDRRGGHLVPVRGAAHVSGRRAAGRALGARAAGGALRTRGDLRVGGAGPDAGHSNRAALLECAAGIVNDTVFGTLSCTLILHPTTQAALPEACERLIARLQYGTIVVNAWTALAYPIDTAAWGGFQPTEDPRAIESGNGFVQNTLLFDHLQKCVVYVPLVNKAQLLHESAPPLDDPKNITNVVEFLLHPGLGTFCGILPLKEKASIAVFWVAVAAALMYAFAS